MQLTSVPGFTEKHTDQTPEGRHQNSDQSSRGCKPACTSRCRQTTSNRREGTRGKEGKAPGRHCNTQKESPGDDGRSPGEGAGAQEGQQITGINILLLYGWNES